MAGEPVYGPLSRLHRKRFPAGSPENVRHIQVSVAFSVDVPPLPVRALGSSLKTEEPGLSPKFCNMRARTSYAPSSTKLLLNPDV